jgi:hypothetical protein
MVGGLVCGPEPPGSRPAQMWVLWDIGNLVGTGRNDRGLLGQIDQETCGVWAARTELSIGLAPLTSTGQSEGRALATL